ncbi:unnamed protein product (mitochondrion) [Plasmodiophora brassicae]|uniref:Uncharacterized protein n=1 Tax=Plasmodiophora brassicae TaxID=37360 RepID=A0A0G4J6E1_PLABS|nr:hypothetical protein PBRA_009361 [Plasmodiophora brassicae]SPR01163.1 unnamed protein product [Plasmodiophora brassicae]
METLAPSIADGDGGACRSRRKLVVRRRQEGQGATKQAAAPVSPRSKKVLVARRIRPGQTLPRVTGGTVTMPEDPALVKAVPQTVLYSTATPRATPPDAESNPAPITDQRELYRRLVEETRAAAAVEREQAARQLAMMPRGDQIAATRESRILKRWERTMASWQRTRQAVAAKLGVSPDDTLTMDTGNAFRERLEAFHLLSIAVPFQKKMATEASWRTSLRGDTTQFVQVGNMFSGLFCEIRNDDNKVMETIRRPTHRVPVQRWKSSPAYQERCREMQRRLHELRPHDVVECDALEVVGQDLFDLRRSAPAYALHDPCLAQVTAPVPPSRSPPRTPRPEPPAEPATVPFVRVTAVGHSDARIALTLSVPAGAVSSASATVVLRNEGNGAVHCEWRRVGTEREERFRWSPQRFTILPGETVPAAFRFESTAPGVFLDDVVLDTFPAASSPFSVHLVGRRLHSRHNVDSVARALRDAIDQERVAFIARRLVYDVVETVRPSPIRSEDRPGRFHRLNNCRTPRLWYIPDIVDALETLAERMRSALSRTARLSARWDHDVQTLYDTLQQALPWHPSAAEWRKELDELVGRCARRPAPSPDAYAVVRGALVDVADVLPDVHVRAMIDVDDDRRKEDEAMRMAQEQQQQQQGAKKPAGAGQARKGAASAAAPTQPEPVAAPPVLDEAAQRERQRRIHDRFQAMIRNELSRALRSRSTAAATAAQPSAWRCQMISPAVASLDDRIVAVSKSGGGATVALTSSRQLLWFDPDGTRRRVQAFDSCRLRDAAVGNDSTIVVVDSRGDILSVNAQGTYCREAQQQGPDATSVRHEQIRISDGITRCSLDDAGRVWTWSPASPTPRQRTFPDDNAVIVDVVAMQGGFLARSQSGKVYQWGRDASSATPVAIPGNVVDVAASGQAGFACTDDGRLWAWGQAPSEGLLGAGTGVAQLPQPTVLEPFAAYRVVRVAGGPDLNVAVSDANDVLVWGGGGAAFVPPTKVPAGGAVHSVFVGPGRICLALLREPGPA